MPQKSGDIKSLQKGLADETSPLCALKKHHDTLAPSQLPNPVYKINDVKTSKSLS